MDDWGGFGLVAVGAVGSDSNGRTNAGAVWLLSLATDGTAHATVKADSNDVEAWEAGDHAGYGLAALDGIDGDALSRQELVVGANRDDDGATDRGAVYIIFLSEGSLPSFRAYAKISSSSSTMNMLGLAKHFGETAGTQSWGQ